MKPGLLYRLLKFYLPLVFRIFYRKIKIHLPENVPLNGPVIFAINHQNAFMDAIVVATASKRNPWFLTRAGVFGSAMTRFWLKKLQMIPIYRFRDGHAGMKRNDETLALCKQLILDNQAILIFPEGNHDRKWRLRPLQKGLARIVFTTEVATNFQSGLKIVPVGLQYENHLNSGSDLLISFGEPIATHTYQQLYDESPAKAVQSLLEDVRAGITKLMVHVPESMHYESSINTLKKKKHRPSDLIARLSFDQKFFTQDEKQTFDVPSNKTKKSYCQFIYYLLMLLHWPALFLIYLIVKKTVKDDAWTSSIKVVVLAFGAPLVHLLQAALLVIFVFSWYWLIPYFALLWLSAKLASYFRAGCLVL